jgi:uncharacterized Zn finger protein (UPF0148 family)
VKKPNIEFKGDNISPRIYCPSCGYTLHCSYKDKDMHVVDERVWENYCPICGEKIDKSDLNSRANIVQKTGKDDLSDDLFRN